MTVFQTTALKTTALKKTVLAIGAGCLGFVSAGCGQDTAIVDALDALSVEQAIPGYEDIAEGSADLALAAAGLCLDPTGEAVDSVRQQLVNLRIEHAGMAAFRHGPAMDERDQGRINTVADPVAIEELILNLDPAVFDAHYVSTSIGATKRGLYAAEYVLFDDANIVATASALSDPLRCQYLEAVLGAIAENLENTVAGWTLGGEIKLPYTAVLANQEHTQDNLNTSVETSVFLLRKIVDMELAPALGLVGTEADPSTLAEGEAAQGLTLLLARLESVDQAIVGDIGVGVLVEEELRDRLQTEISEAQAQVESLMATHGPSLHAALAADPGGVELLHDLIVTVERTLSTEVVGDLNVVVGFSDADGDSAN